MLAQKHLKFAQNPYLPNYTYIKIQHKTIGTTFINPHSVGGGGNRTLNPETSPKRKQVATRNLPCLSKQQLRSIMTKHQVAGHNRSVVNDVRMTSCFADFDQNMGLRETLTRAQFKATILKLRSIVLHEMT